ncbi:DUF317 domain-containing protein [Streptomyces scopuliridis]|uniref:DUF317 domain-containing protein n=1 Tax=Streptomyces scopuliridis TaxID=452529 RepID=A0ACD4ZSX5_9ACTN|nr:DUF317 domain-containing protein [Streptomyces scopuliridis]WSC01550.1 DUF317 domain-containing protein [Streptomyces scopuliridis]WSC04912.1 DUF317 domain-containing protein [Streptomyces scopuliridis]
MKRRQRRPAGWSPAGAELPQPHYLVEPRHLAGGGDMRHITEYLCASGWKDRTPRAGSPLCFESPDRTVRVGYAEHIIPPTWTVSCGPQNDDGAGAGWHATFGAAVPVEILAGFTDALTRPPAPHAPDVWRPLAQRDWAVGKKGHHTASSPDGSAMLQFRQEEGRACWWACANATTVAGTSSRVWSAVLSDTAPLYAVEGFAAALSDPRPLLRPPGHIPFAAARQVTATPYMVLPSQLGAWQRTRLAAARATTRAKAGWSVNRARPTGHTPPAYTTPAGAGGRRR